MSAYYNEIDPYAAQWLRNLIAAGHIAPGEVDERSIEDVRPDDLRGYTQCHFFAGIGVWSLALRRAGWPDDRPVWTGSCPCQPFSAAGKRGGTADERHLWPAFHHLIAECGPPVVLGEQVASKDGLGWLDLVQADMEGEDYAFGAVDLCAAGVGAPHIRQRLWWIAERGVVLADACQPGLSFGSVADVRCGIVRHEGAPVAASVVSGRVADADGGNAGTERQQRSGEQRQQQEDGRTVGMAEPHGTGLQPRERDDQAARHGHSVTAAGGDDRHGRPGPTNGFWRDADWLFCRDGKWRPVKPGTFPLVDGATFRMGSGSTFEGKSRTGMLKAAGNAIVADAAQAFIEAYLASHADRLRLTSSSILTTDKDVFA